MSVSKKIITFMESDHEAPARAAGGVYTGSFHMSNGCSALMVDNGDADMLIVSDGFGFSGEPFTADGKAWVLAPLTHENAQQLRKIFPFTAPVPVLKKPRTVGVGDRLGIATPGHIRALKEYDAYPVFAQQSIRELTLTGRTFDDVLDCATFAVFRCNYTRGFGADGDHLKTADEVATAIACGYTMITLDCSEHIRNDVQSMTDEQALAAYRPDPALEEKYIGKVFSVGGHVIGYDRMSFVRMSLVYNDAIAFAASIYHQFFAGREDALDFEVSIDETATPTEPAQHFYVASELFARGVVPATVAPRFCGEFQKGIDYIGDLARFEAEFRVHAAIARHFGYKISVHSGSDKFSVFETVGRETNGHFHVKTAGTNWLEAMKIIAAHEPALYREVHQYALDVAFAQARQYYHVTTSLGNIPPLASLSDAALPGLFDNNDARQLIHITYGLILNAKDDGGKPLFRERLYRAWRAYADEYAAGLEQHIGRHLRLLYAGMEQN